MHLPKELLGSLELEDNSPSLEIGRLEKERLILECPWSSSRREKEEEI
jgi:hypothetical protein